MFYVSVPQIKFPIKINLSYDSLYMCLVILCVAVSCIVLVYSVERYDRPTSIAKIMFKANHED